MESESELPPPKKTKTDELCDVEWNDSEILCASIVAGSYKEMESESELPPPKKTKTPKKNRTKA